MEKDFFDVFPSLKVKKELEELLDMVFVTRVSCNPSRTHIWVYIKSERWIHKKHIFELEEQIERQIFAGLNVTVTVIEKFRLSGQYNPQNFLETYRSSMELELRSYNMLEYNMFRQAQISFPGENDLHMILPDSVIAREKSGILIEYLQKVFCERCGMDLKVELEFRETQESKYRKNAAVQIAQEVENVIRHAKLNSKNEEPVQSEEAGTAEKKAEKKALKYLEKVGLKGFEKSRASKLSSGQKQRLAIARALAKETDIIMADEPTGNLDSETGRQIVELLKSICASGSAIMMTTHNLHLLSEYPGIVYRFENHQIKEVTNEYSRAIKREKEQETEEKTTNVTI